MSLYLIPDLHILIIVNTLISPRKFAPYFYFLEFLFPYVVQSLSQAANNDLEEEISYIPGQ